jgi:hypothetical protein
MIIRLRSRDGLERIQVSVLPALAVQYSAVQRAKIPGACHAYYSGGTSCLHCLVAQYQHSSLQVCTATSLQQLPHQRSKLCHLTLACMLPSSSPAKCGEC